jgi:3',5'-cyclic AMP phosphodiesterase CpdA
MSRSISRREMLRLGGAGLLGLGLWPGCLLGEPNAASSEEFSFIAINDLHYLEAACRPWFDKVVKQIKSSAPRAEFCLLGGDLADNGTVEQLTGIRDAFAGLGIPLHAVIGNHDHLTDTDRSAYEEIFPGQFNYHFEHRGWQVIGLDSSDGTKWVETIISDATLRWLDDNLPKLEVRKPTIVFTHFPLGESVPMQPLNADAALQRLAHFNVQAIFSGHFHGFTERYRGDASLTTDRCCARVRNNHDGTKEKGWFLCQASGGCLSRQFVEFRAEA